MFPSCKDISSDIHFFRVDQSIYLMINTLIMLNTNSANHPVSASNVCIRHLKLYGRFYVKIISVLFIMDEITYACCLRCSQVVQFNIQDSLFFFLKKHYINRQKRKQLFWIKSFRIVKKQFTIDEYNKVVILEIHFFYRVYVINN